MRLFVTGNRKRESASDKLLPLTKGLLLSGVIVTIGFGYIWQKNSIIKLGDDIKQREQQLDVLHRRNVVLRDQVAALESPRVIDYKCKAWNLGLGMPKESQIVRVVDPMLAPVLNGPPAERSDAPIPSGRKVVARYPSFGRTTSPGEMRAN